MIEELARIPGRSRVCVGVPVPESDRERAHAVHRDLAVGRDRRHAGGHARGAAARRSHARHRERRRLDDRARGGGGDLSARRAGDRCGVHQGVHEPGRGARAPHAQDSAGSATCRCCEGARSSDALQALPEPDPADPRPRARRSRTLAEDFKRAQNFLYLGAATISRPRSRARSSSRRSATSTPRAIRRRR